MELTKAGLGAIPSLSSTGAAAGKTTPTGAFGNVLSNLVQNTMDAQTNAQGLSMQAASGADVPMQQVVQALSKAELTLQTLVTVRDKAVEAYQQIQQMPI